MKEKERVLRLSSRQRVGGDAINPSTQPATKAAKDATLPTSRFFFLPFFYLPPILDSLSA
jgi:hypothetical protein